MPFSKHPVAPRCMALVLVVAASGCGDDAIVVAPDPGTVAGEGDTPAPPESAVIYAILNRNPEGFAEYLMAGPSVPADTIDTSQGLELPGGNYYAQPDGVLYGNFETGTLQRYQVGPDYSVRLTGELSLANYGIPFINTEPMVFSPTRAFYLDAESEQLIIFDPTQMLIIGDMPLPELTREGFTASLGDPVKVGERFITTVVYYDSTSSGALAPDSTLGLIVQDDPEQPIRLLRDERAPAAGRAFVDPAGDFYALADAGGGYPGLTGLQPLQSPGLLRVRSGAEAIDPGYLLDLGALLDTPAVNGLWHLQGSRFVLQAWASELDPASVLAEPGAYDVDPNFDWFVVDAVTEEVRPISGLERAPPSYTLLQFRVDDTLYVQQYRIENGDYNQGHVELYALGADEVATKVADTTRGDLRVLSRVSIRPD